MPDDDKAYMPLAERAGRWVGSWREFAAFLLVGAIRTLLGYGIYLLLVLFLPYGVAYTLAYAVGIFLAYYLNARFVFREERRLSNALQFPLVYLAQYLVGVALLSVLIERAHVSKFFAPIAVIIVTVPCTFLLSRYVIKRG